MRVIAYSRTITNKNAEILSSNVNNAKLITTQEDGKEGFDNVKTTYYCGISNIIIK